MTYVTNPTPGPHITSPLEGPTGRAERIPLNQADPAYAETVCWWLLDAPGWTPAWDKYVICAVRLRDNIPGFPPPVRTIEDATHEIMILALHPDYPATVETMTAPGYQLQHLQPGNLAHQLEATDDEVEQLVGLMCWTICHGYMPPEPPLGYESFRADWAATIAKTLAHQRGEAHAS